MPRTRITAVPALVLTLAVGASAVTPTPARAARLCTVPGTGKPLDSLWRPDTRAAIAYARARGGDISFAVRTAHRFYGLRPDHVVPSASVVKAMLMVAYLDLPSVRNRALNGFDFSLLIPMITQSSKLSTLMHQTRIPAPARGSAVNTPSASVSSNGRRRGGSRPARPGSRCCRTRSRRWSSCRSR